MYVILTKQFDSQKIQRINSLVAVDTMMDKNVVKAFLLVSSNCSICKTA